MSTGVKGMVARTVRMNIRGGDSCRYTVTIVPTEHLYEEVHAESTQAARDRLGDDEKSFRTGRTDDIEVKVRTK